MLLETWSPSPIYLWYLPFSQIWTGSLLSFATISAAQNQPSTLCKTEDQYEMMRPGSGKTKGNDIQVQTGSIHEELLLSWKEGTWVNLFCIVDSSLRLRKIIINPGFIQPFLSLFLFGEFLFFSWKGEFARCHQGQTDLSQGWVGTKRLALHSQSDFFGNWRVHTDRRDSGCPSPARNLLEVRGIASDMEKSLFWLWILLLPHADATQAITALACWDSQEKLDEQEAVNRRTGASVQLANSLPGSLALRVPYCLPVQQLIPV